MACMYPSDENRQTDSSAPPSASPWHSSHVHQQESAMRSTIFAPRNVPSPRNAPTSPPTPPNAFRRLPTPNSSQHFINPQQLYSDPYRDPPPPQPAWNAVNVRLPEEPKGVSPAEFHAQSALRLLDRSDDDIRYRKTPTNNAIFYQNYGSLPPVDPALGPFSIDMNELQVKTQDLRSRTNALQLNEEWEADRGDGRVYHINHWPGSAYSGTWDADDPNDIDPRAELMINDIEERQQKPGKLETSCKLLAQAREVFARRDKFVLQRASFVAEGEIITCRRPGCRRKTVKPNCYYIVVDQDVTFCLRCFEELWDGHCTDGKCTQEIPQLYSRRDSAIDLSLRIDGIPQAKRPVNAGVEDFFEEARTPDCPSSQPPADHQLSSEPPNPSTPQPGHTSVDDVSDASPSSITSEGEWRYPPEPLQHFATSIEAGPTLSAQDKAVLNLWQLVSREQTDWIRHLAKTKCRRAYYAGETKRDEGLNITTPAHTNAEEDSDEKELIAKSGLRKKDCQGQNLSYVFDKVPSKNRM